MSAPPGVGSRMMFLFRADGNPSIGVGHVMRCMSIADAARDAGIECAFVTAGDEFPVVIEGRGYRDIVLSTDYRDMDNELPQFVRLIEAEQPAAVFVDSYYVTGVYLDELKRAIGAFGGRLIYIDDIIGFPYPCEILLNYNIYAGEGEYRALYDGVAVPELLLGTTYAPLRSEFIVAHRRYVDMGNDDDEPDGLPSYITDGDSECDMHVRKVFVSTGGADFEHLMIELVRAVKVLLDADGYEFHFVLGAANEDKECIRAEVSEVKSIRLHENVTDMADLMCSCDVAISAAGSTLYELCACRIPTITYILADNQIPGARGFEGCGIMKCAGDVRDIGTSELASRLIEMAVELCGDEDERRTMAERQGSVVDGRGAERIVRAVMY